LRDLDAFEAGHEISPCFSGNPWPLGTIAKEYRERKGKTAKNIVKMGFFRARRRKTQLKCGFSTPYTLGLAPGAALKR
jgi:hypothetical protein